MIILAKNITSNDIVLDDLMGITIAANSSLELTENASLLELAQCNSLLSLIATNQLVINDSLRDLSATDAIRYISLTDRVATTAVDGREIVKSSSIPFNTQTCFTMVGDSSVGIGDGNKMEWNASSDNWITDSSSPYIIYPLPDGFKRSIMRLRFNDPVYIKEGALFYWGVQKGTYVDFIVVCPQGQYYYNRNKEVNLATSHIPISHYAMHHFIYDTCPCGIYVNAETCQDIATPINYETWFCITVPQTDTSSFGFARFTLYRKRTSLYPGELL